MSQTVEQIKALEERKNLQAINEAKKAQASDEYEVLEIKEIMKNRNWQEYACLKDCKNVQGENEIKKGEIILVDCDIIDKHIFPKDYGGYYELKDKGFYLAYEWENDFDYFLEAEQYKFYQEARQE
jgi:hypothetical protein